jgi:hypothetical protein
LSDHPNRSKTGSQHRRGIFRGRQGLYPRQDGEWGVYRSVLQLAAGPLPVDTGRLAAVRECDADTDPDDVADADADDRRPMRRTVSDQPRPLRATCVTCFVVSPAPSPARERESRPLTRAAQRRQDYVRCQVVRRRGGWGTFSCSWHSWYCPFWCSSDVHISLRILGIIKDIHTSSDLIATCPSTRITRLTRESPR